MNKNDALKRLDSLENEAKELRKIINTVDSYTLNDLNSYKDACKILSIPEDSYPSAKTELKIIIRASNFIDNGNTIWIADWDNVSKYKYAPCFTKNKNGLGFGLDFVHGWDFCLCFPLAFYYKVRSTAEIIVKRFLPLYNRWIQE